MGYNWNWAFFFQDRGDGTTFVKWLLVSWAWTAAVAFGALIVALVVGSIMGVLRTLPNRGLVLLGDAWSEFFRNVPLLVQIFTWYFVVPAILPFLKGVPSIVMVIVALGFFTSARIADSVRAGIMALPLGQTYAGLAMGFTRAQTYRYVLLPMAARVVIPPITSESMNIIKNSAVAFAVSIPELTMFAMQAQEETSRGFEIYIAVTIAYVITALVVNRLAKFVESRVKLPGMHGAH